MRHWQTLTPLILALGAGLIWLAFLSEPSGRWLTKYFSKDSDASPAVGQIITLDGRAQSTLEGEMEELHGPLSAPRVLRSGEKLDVDANSRAVVELNSKDEVALEALSSVTFLLWDKSKTESPVYVYLNTGRVELYKAGEKGKAYIIRDGKLYSPGQRMRERPMALTVLRSAPLDMELAQNEAAEEVIEDDMGEPPAAGPADPETLSNEYIDEMIVHHQPQLQRCWLSRIKEFPQLKGQMVLQFEINRRGRVKEVQAVESSIEDEQLKRCVATVFERIQFRPFKGSEIVLTYPLHFE